MTTEYIKLKIASGTGAQIESDLEINNIAVATDSLTSGIEKHNICLSTNDGIASFRPAFINGVEVFSSVASVNSIAELKNLPVATYKNATVYGYYTSGDGGGGTFSYVEDSIEADDGGAYISPNVGSGKWHRAFIGDASVKFWGAYGDNSHDDISAINAAVAFSNVSNRRVYIPGGEYFVSDTIDVVNGMYMYGDGPIAQGGDDSYPVSIEHAPQLDKAHVWRITFPTDNTLDLDSYVASTVVRITFCDVEEHNGPHEVYSTDPLTNTMLISHGAYLTDTEYNWQSDGAYDGDTWEPVIDEDSHTCIVTVKTYNTGTALKMQNGDGDITTGKKFFDAYNAQNITIKGIGFVGPGVNASSGGTLKFTRRQDLHKALTSYTFEDLSIQHISGNGLQIDQPINSSFRNIFVEQCSEDGIVFKPTSDGSTTSVHFDTIYIKSVRRGMYMRQCSYCVVNNIVIESCSVGMYLYGCTGWTFNDAAMETIKLKHNQGGMGTFIYSRGSYGNTFNGLTAFYNTEFEGWSHSVMTCVDTPSYESSASVFGGRLHKSLSSQKRVVAYRLYGNSLGVPLDAAIIVYDTYNNLNADYWRVDRKVQLINIDGYSVPLGADELEEFNAQHKITDIDNYADVATYSTTTTVDPTVNDDAAHGITFMYGWSNTSNTKKWVCIDTTNGAAVWVETKNLTRVRFDFRHLHTSSGGYIRATGTCMKVGRNIGADIVTCESNRVWEMSKPTRTTMNLFLDIENFAAAKFTHNIRNADGSLLTEGIQCHEFRVENISGTNYIKYRYPMDAGTIEIPGVNDDLTLFPSTMIIQYNQYRTDYRLQTAFEMYDFDNLNWYLYVPASSYMTGVTSLVYSNSMFDKYNGEYNIDSYSIEETTFLWKNKPIPVLKVTVTVADGPMLDVANDYGSYSFNTMAKDNSPLGVSGGNVYSVIDPNDCIDFRTSRGGTATIPNGSTYVDVLITNADHYNYSFYSDSSEYVYASSKTQTTVRFSRSGTSGDLVIRYTAVMKKNLDIRTYRR